MKKFKYLILFVSLLVLTGCSERELTFDRLYPDTSSLDEARAKKLLELELEIKKEGVDLASTLKKENKRPRTLHLSSINDLMGYSADVTQYCWANKRDECERIQPIHPNDISGPFYNLNYLRVAAKEKLSLGVDISGSVLVPFPARVEAYVYDENKNLHLYEAIDNPGKNFYITAPLKLGSYIFQFKLYYEGDVEGISYHPHGITVIAPE